MRIHLSSIFVDDQDKALRFYTEVLGFQKKTEIPFASFAVDDIGAEFERLRALGVRFAQEPVEMGPVTTAVFDDTCGNLIQIAQRGSEGAHSQSA